MTGASFLGVGAALAFVLALLALLVRVLRGFALSRPASQAHLLEVVARVGLAPKQGVAAVRFGSRTVLVSYGEGGVRTLVEAQADGEVAVESALGPAALTRSGLSFASVLAKADARASEVGGEDGTHPAVAVGGASVGVEAPKRPRRALRGLRSVFRIRSAGLLAALALFAGGAADLRAAPATVPVAQVARDTATASPASGAEGRPMEDLLADALRSVGVGGGSDSGEGGLKLSGPVGTVIFLGFLTTLPTLLLLMTSFTRILVVLHLLKQAIGTQTAPPAHLLAAMSLLLTGFVMSPTLSEVNRTALTPWLDGQIDEAAMLSAASIPFRNFMLEGAREADLGAFVDMSGTEPETVDEIPLVVVTSAFVTSELTNAFKMGFALFLPFIVIDVVVASILMSMGMFMLPPVMVSLPFKLLLFVLVDGWSLVVGSLVQSFG